jgi:tetratricopeptide (TPR) repeat protein
MRSMRGRRAAVVLSLWLQAGTLVAARRAWAQAGGGGRSLLDELWQGLAEIQALANNSTMLQYAAYAVGGIVVLWLLSRLPRLLRLAGAGAVAAPSRSQNLREARRAARRGDHIQAGRFYEAAEDWENAAESYERGRAFADAAGVWERVNQPARAARLYEQANETSKAAELFARLGNHARAAGLFQKGGQEVKAAEAYERAGDLERAAGLYAKHEVFDRAGELLARLGQHAQAAELLDRALRRLIVRQGVEMSPEAVPARQALARRCGDLYARGQQPAKAAAVLREHGLEVDAAEYFCQAGDWEAGLDIFLRHRQFDRAAATCRAQGAEDRLHIVQGERLAADGREQDAAREFEAGQAWWRAAEMYERARDYAKAAEMYGRQGDDERAAEMHAAAGEPAQAAAALERLGKPKDAARYYQQAGAIQQAATALQAAGDFFGAGSLLVQAQALDEAVALLQQVSPESERYLEATIMLGDLFLERQLYGPAKEKFEKAATLRPIAPDFVHPTYQLAVIHEQQGDPQKALALFEKVMAEQLGYRDVQTRVADLRERLAQRTQVVPGGDATQVVASPARTRYRIIKELGRGGMGIVYHAEDEVLQRPVAYKVLPDAIREDPKALEYFLREARIAASLQHPNIVTIYDAGQAGDEIYIAMEYVEGRSLQQILDQVSILPLPRALGIFHQACQGLAHAHGQNIVHRDVKPANMMIASGGVVKLMDFGLAAVVTEAMARVTSVRGTPFYMAPEQILGEEISALSDQYALGCTLYHMVTGRPPFVEGDVLYHHIHTAPISPRERNPQVPAWLDAIILRTILKDQPKRFPSVAVLLQEMDRCLASARGSGPVSGQVTP